MPYTISGTVNSPSRIIVLKSDYSIDTTTVASGNDFNVEVATSSGVIVIGRELATGYVIGYGGLTPVYTYASNARGIVAGGYNPSNQRINNIDYFTISTNSNASDFGDLTVNRYAVSAVSNGASGRAVFVGGGIDGPADSNVMDYITILSLGNAADFGDATITQSHAAGVSNEGNNMGVICGGLATNTMDYIRISILSNATDFGDLTYTVWGNAGTSAGIADRGVICGGHDGGSTYWNTINYFTISCLINAVEFGDLTLARRFLAATSNAINNRAVVGGGYSGSGSNIIDYFSIFKAAATNATDFGDLSVALYTLGATSNGSDDLGVFTGGNSTNKVNIIEKITISTLGNSADFGDLTVAKSYVGATSNAASFFVSTQDGYDRGVFTGGENGTTPYLNVMDYITIATTGNAADFGDLINGPSQTCCTSNGKYNKGFTIGGYTYSPMAAINVIQYFAISVSGANAKDYGDLTADKRTGSATSNGYSNRGIFGGGGNSGTTLTNVIDYKTLNAPSSINAVDFGDLSLARWGLQALSNLNNNRGVFNGGGTGSSPGDSQVNIMDYITISTTGNASDFGDLLDTKSVHASTSNGTNDRGLIGPLENIQYITISTTGNSVNFGNLTQDRVGLTATSNAERNRGIWAGGSITINIIDYMTITSIGNASDFGDLTIGRLWLGATSNA